MSRKYNIKKYFRKYFFHIQWDEPFWILGDVATKKVPIFELCDTEGDTAS